MDAHTAPAVDVTAFRKAMGAFPTGVTVVTVASGDGDDTLSNGELLLVGVAGPDAGAGLPQ